VDAKDLACIKDLTILSMAEPVLTSAKDFEGANIFGCTNIFVHIFRHLYFCVFFCIFI
jgi:hypothetical protein